MKITRYKATGPQLKAAVVADLHGKPTDVLYNALEAERPDVILIPGDLATVGEYNEKFINAHKREKILKTQDGAIAFLKTAVDIAPVFYSRGNHEWGDGELYYDRVRETGAVLLENQWVEYNGVFIGGQNAAKCGTLYCDGKEIVDKKVPEVDWLKNSPEGFKILLCHHPEYYDLVEQHADLIVSGHTHGGQWRLFDRGVFVPKQGLFPKYTKGQYGIMIVSAGLTNTTKIPRLFNPTELVIVEIG